MATWVLVIALSAGQAATTSELYTAGKALAVISGYETGGECMVAGAQLSNGTFADKTLSWNCIPGPKIGP
jgi:hypothetical protein